MDREHLTRDTRRIQQLARGYAAHTGNIATQAEVPSEVRRALLAS
jgi:hypothetical protein